jgi:aminoglycoside 6'-N-acetyltransferase
MIRLIFERTPVARVHAITDARNVPCIRLLERIGMRQVGTLNTSFRGEPCVEHVFEICRRRWA